MKFDSSENSQFEKYWRSDKTNTFFQVSSFTAPNNTKFCQQWYQGHRKIKIKKSYNEIFVSCTCRWMHTWNWRSHIKLHNSTTSNRIAYVRTFLSLDEAKSWTVRWRCATSSYTEINYDNMISTTINIEQIYQLFSWSQKSILSEKTQIVSNLMMIRTSVS